MPPRDAPIDPTGLPAEYDERLIRIAQLHYDFVIDPAADGGPFFERMDDQRNVTNTSPHLLCWDAVKREWLTWAQWIFNRQPR